MATNVFNTKTGKVGSKTPDVSCLVKKLTLKYQSSIENIVVLLIIISLQVK